MNIIIIIMDSLRQDHVGAYGNDWIRTPFLDAFAKESVAFTRCYSESMPTIQFRKTIHTGRRVFPFKEDKPAKTSIGPAPGWGPIPHDHVTVAEILRNYGYRSALITDTYHQFRPSYNFHRGFDSWQWIRGQEADWYISGPEASDDEIGKHMNERAKDHEGLRLFLKLYLQNCRNRGSEEDFGCAKVFRTASQWLYQNQDSKRFFMVVDSFDPHEPWDPPAYYRRMYDPDDDVADLIQTPYCPWRDVMNERELKRIQANYAGKVTMTDRWFGHFIETLRVSGRLSDTIVAVMSDHGHNLGFDPKDKGFVDKHGHPMTRAVADLVMLIRHPSGKHSGSVCNNLAYNHDVVFTLLSLAGVEPPKEFEGISIWPGVESKAVRSRGHVVFAWGSNIVVIKDRFWYNANVFGEGALLYDMETDPDLLTSIAQENPKICSEMLALVVEEAGGEVPKNKFRSFGKKSNSRLWRYGEDGETYCSTTPIAKYK